MNVTIYQNGHTHLASSFCAASVLLTAAPSFLKLGLSLFHFLATTGLFFYSLKTMYSRSESLHYKSEASSSLVLVIADKLFESRSHTLILSNWGLSFIIMPTTKLGSENCSPNIVRTESSHNLEVWFFITLTSSWQPSTSAASSQSG